MNFVSIGADRPEWMAGAIAEIARENAREDFRHIDPSTARVILVEGGTSVFSPASRGSFGECAKTIADLGVEVMTGVRAENLTENGVEVGRQFIPCRVKIWAAGKRLLRR